MSVEWLSILSSFGAMLLTGSIIKLVDDYMDADEDICHGARTFAARIGKQALPYGFVLIALAAVANVQITASLLLASLGIGMLSSGAFGKRWNGPFGLQAVAAAALSVWIAGPWLTLWSISMVSLANWLDDLVDIPTDRLSRQPNFVIRLGLIPVVTLSLVALLLAVVANAMDTVLGLCALALINVLAESSTQHLWKTTDEEEHQKRLQ